MKTRITIFVLLMFGLRDSLFCADAERIAVESGKPFGERRGIDQAASPVVVGGDVENFPACCAKKDELELARLRADDQMMV